MGADGGVCQKLREGVFWLEGKAGTESRRASDAGERAWVSS